MAFCIGSAFQEMFVGKMSLGSILTGKKVVKRMSRTLGISWLCMNISENCQMEANIPEKVAKLGKTAERLVARLPHQLRAYEPPPATFSKISVL